MRLAGVLSILSVLHIFQGVMAPFCASQGSFGQPSRHLCDNILELDFPNPNSASRIFSTDTNPAPSDIYISVFPRVLTPIKHQRVVRSNLVNFFGLIISCAVLTVVIDIGCAIAIFNDNAESDSSVTFSVNSWSRVLDAIMNILNTCSPYGGSEKVLGGEIPLSSVARPLNQHF